MLIDFSDCAGQSFILYNDAPAPFPDGDAAESTTTPGPRRRRTRTLGPNTRTLMRITITTAKYVGPPWSTRARPAWTRRSRTWKPASG